MKKTVYLGLLFVVSGCGSPDPSKDAAAVDPALVSAPAPISPVSSPAPAPLPAQTPTQYTNSVAAADCSFASVEKAVAQVGPKTTVIIPAGDCNWGTSSLVVPGGIYIKGSGQNATTLRRGGAVGETASLIKFVCAPGSDPVMLSDLQLVGAGRLDAKEMGVRLEKNCITDFRIFNTRLSRFTFSAIMINGEGSSALPRGVIYQNEIFNNYTVGVNNLGYGVSVYANSQPGSLDAVLGSAEAVFVENNIFSGNRHSIASNAGARYVFRHNTVTTTNEVRDWGQVDAHGTTSSASKSTFSWEIYDNKFTSIINEGDSGWATLLRGGNGVIFNNSYAKGVTAGVGLTLEKGCGGGLNYPVADQIRSVHIWGNSVNAVKIYSGGGDCTPFFRENRDYYFAARPGYTPYTYPHPLRSL
jgi:hypothetical protein